MNSGYWTAIVCDGSGGCLRRNIPYLDDDPTLPGQSVDDRMAVVSCIQQRGQPDGYLLSDKPDLLKSSPDADGIFIVLVVCGTKQRHYLTFQATLDGLLIGLGSYNLVQDSGYLDRGNPLLK